ncbi:hypothetical protein AGMMS50293_30260 [Spirochaetia bacterium]|nr:hypothetical protein AGMMS50293_30260 [Spirochaetia bacterium]
MTAPQNMDPPETQAQGALIAARAFLTTYAVPLALPGLPAVYFHSWTGSRAWKEGPEKLGYNRAINREKPAIDLIEKELADPLSFRSLVLRGFEKLMEFRAAEAAFNPGVPCKVLAGAGAKGTDCGARGTDCGARGMDCGARGMDCGGIFALYRGQESSGARGMDCGVICIQNFSPAEVQFDPGIASLGEISVPGHGLCWLAFDSGGIRRELVI